MSYSSLGCVLHSRSYCPSCPRCIPPSSAEWNGEGLPPVGVECEVDGLAFPVSGGGGSPISGGGGGGSSMGGISWVKCTVIAHEEVNGALAAVVNSGRKIGWAYSSTKFRPICTPEQIAAEEREMAIEEMRQFGVDAGDSTIDLTCAALYDAGCRMPGKGAKA